MAFLVLVSVGLACAGWIFEAGSRLARAERGIGFDNVGRLRERIAELEVEVARLTAAAGASESNLRIERTAQEQLVTQMKALQEENGRLKDDVAFFESLAAPTGATNPTPTINRLQVARDGGTGSYRFRALLVRHGGRRGEEDFHGSLQLVVSVLQHGKAAIIVYPRGDSDDRKRFEVNFRHFQRVDGTFMVPPDAQVKQVEVRLLQGGVARDTQSVSL